MENIVEFPDRKVVEQEALDWIIKLDADDELTKEQLIELKAWLSRSPAHREELIELNKFWQNNVLTELMVPLGNPQATFKNSLLAFLTPLLATRRQLAMSAFAIVLSFSFLANMLITDNVLLETNGIYVTALGKQNNLMLSDGTEVFLNTNSQIEVSYSNNYRNIRVLQGQAHFEVAKNKDYPFRVYAGDGRVEALGTAFSVHLEQHNMDVLVTEGKVAVAALATSMDNSADGKAQAIQNDDYANSMSKTLGTLIAGQRVSVNLADEKLAVLEGIETLSKAEVERQQAWQDGLLVFSGQPLEEVVFEISRFSNVNIEIIDEKLKDLKIGGRFRVGEVEGLLQSLENNFGVEVTRLGYSRVQLSLAK